MLDSSELRLSSAFIHEADLEKVKDEAKAKVADAEAKAEAKVADVDAEANAKVADVDAKAKLETAKRM